MPRGRVCLLMQFTGEKRRSNADYARRILSIDVATRGFDSRQLHQDFASDALRREVSVRSRNQMPLRLIKRSGSLAFELRGMEQMVSSLGS